MKPFVVPTRDTVPPANQALFDSLHKAVGRVPNLYASFAHSESALGAYLALQSARSALSPREREVVNLAVSQVNDCAYCLAAHTLIAKHLGFTVEHTLLLRQGRAPFDSKLNALARLARDTAEHRGHASADTVEAFLAAGYTEAELVDTVLAVGTIIVTNYLYALTQVPIDFPPAPPMEA